MRQCRAWGFEAVLSLVFGVVSGIFGALCIYSVVTYLQSLRPVVPSAVVLGPPLFIGAFVLTNYLHVGLLGSILPRYNRERWSSLNARCHVVQALWLVAFGITVYGPWLIETATCGTWNAVLGSVLGGGWVGTTLAGLWAGNSTSKHQWQSTVWEKVAQAAPYVFVIGALVLVSYGSTRWIRQLYDSASKQCDAFTVVKGKALNEAYLVSLDRPTCNLLLPLPVFGTVPAHPIACLLSGAVIAFSLAWMLSSRVGVNAFSLHDLYALRLIRCYLGASRESRNPNPLTNLDSRDDEHLSRLANSGESGDTNCGPFPILNGTLNRKVASKQGSHQQRLAEALSFQDRQGESFIFSPLYCGSESTGYCRTRGFAEDIKIGTAVAVSGAAVSPNQGHYSSPAVAALLTAFNVRLGAWFGNPSKPRFRNIRNPPTATLKYFLNELRGVVTADRDYVYVSDGGHFENMGVYELIRRRCRFIVAVDSWADPALSRENLGRLVRQVRVDFGIRIEVDIDETKIAENGFCNAHFSLGKIHYGDIHPARNIPGTSTQPALNDPNYHHEFNEGMLIYLKVGLTGDEPNDLLNYQAKEPLFPHQPISDQFFDEAQFESYRELGFHTVKRLLEGRPESPSADQGPFHALAIGPEIAHKVQAQTTEDAFSEVFRRWMSLPANRRTGLYAQFNQEYSKLMAELRSTPQLQRLAIELYGGDPIFKESHEESGTLELCYVKPTNAERLMVLEMMTLLGSVWFELSLDQYHLHPINSGWMKVFRRWLASPLVLNQAYSLRLAI